jgi:aminoglycoside 3-N-acetyltransferase
MSNLWRKWARDWRWRIKRALYHFGPTHVRRALDQLGLAEGSTVMVHSSYARLSTFDGGAVELVKLVAEAAGQSGTVMMPTLPFTGSAIEYVRTNPVFSVRRTPSAMGLLTEIFRRMPGVTRSVHPTHPVAAKGPLANELLRSHPLAETPCGAGSPFAKLLDVDGWILLMGVGIRSMTFFHAIEALLEPKMPFSPFTKERFTLQCEVDGRLLSVGPMRLYDPAVGARRKPELLEPELRRRGHWRQVRVGNAKLILLRAREVYAVAEALADAGTYCYAAGE